MYLTASNNLKFIKKIIPESRLNIETKIKSFKRGIAVCNGVGTVDGSIACKADFTLILPDQLKIYNLQKTEN
jgi:3-hydroxymyristoyl/3-hydroxydecanoyl-(acyl carrier protein) dehydratase